MSSEALRAAALALPREDRASLAHDLLRSLEEPTDPGVEAAWLDEIEKRARELADGSVVPVEWSAARDRILRRLRERRG